MRRVLASMSLLALLGVGLLIPGLAMARAVLWGGTGSNDLGPSTALLSVANGRVKVTSVQIIMACTDAEDGSESSRAFSTHHLTATSLRANHYAITFSATSGGRVGHLHLRGTLGSNGRGTIRIDMTATARTAGGAIVERCQAASHFALRRGA